MQDKPQFGNSGRQPNSQKNLQLLANEMLEIRNLLSQQLQQHNMQEDLNVQVELQKKELQLTNVVLKRLAESLDQYKAPDYQSTFQALSQQIENLNSINNQLKKIVSQSDSSAKLSRLEDKIGSLKSNMIDVNEKLEEQQELLQLNFDWKVLAAQIVGISLVTTTMLVIGLRIFPPHPQLDKELQVIYGKVEQIRKAKK